MARSTRSARSPASRIISARAASSGPNDALARPDGGIERSVSAHDREHADGARPQPVVLLASRRALRLECCQIGIDRAQVGLRQYLAGVGRHGVDRNANLMVEGFERQPRRGQRSEEHTSELQSLMRNSYAV